MNRASNASERMVIAMPMANRGCKIGPRIPDIQLRAPFGLLLSLLHGASNRMRVISSGGGSTSAARSMNSTAAAESRASSAHAGHWAKWPSTADLRSAESVPSR